MSNIVAIVGRPNVGKSTLYNRLTESRKAIVDDVSGVTRDRHYGVSEWTNHSFTVVDTGGYVANSDDVFEAAIREQVIIAIEEATVILFMVDVTTGITDLDDEIVFGWKHLLAAMIADRRGRHSGQQLDAFEAAERVDDIIEGPEWGERL